MQKHLSKSDFSPKCLGKRTAFSKSATFFSFLAFGFFLLPNSESKGADQPKCLKALASFDANYQLFKSARKLKCMSSSMEAIYRVINSICTEQGPKNAAGDELDEVRLAERNNACKSEY